MTNDVFYFTGFDPVSSSYAVFAIKNDKSRMVEMGFDCMADAVGLMDDLEPDDRDYYLEEADA